MKSFADDLLVAGGAVVGVGGFIADCRRSPLYNAFGLPITSLLVAGPSVVGANATMMSRPRRRPQLAGIRLRFAAVVAACWVGTF